MPTARDWWSRRDFAAASALAVLGVALAIGVVFHGFGLTRTCKSRTEEGEIPAVVSCEIFPSIGR